MKDSKFAKLIAVISATVLLVGALVGITVLAEDASQAADTTKVTSVGIVSANINYAAKLEYVYAVSAEELADNAEVVMLFFSKDPEVGGELSADKLYAKALYRKTAATETINVNGVDCLIFTSRGIAPQDAASSFYAIPVVRYDNGEAGFSYERGYTRRTASADGNGAYIYEHTARKSGLVLYAVQKLIGTAAITDAQESLYNSIINYAEAATNRFGKEYAPDYAYLKLSGVTIDGIPDNGVYNDVSSLIEDGKITLKAPLTNADGQVFDYWIKDDGTRVESLSLEIADARGMIESYSASYGSNCVNKTFDDFELGTYALPTSASGENWFYQSGGKATAEIIDQGDGDYALQVTHPGGVASFSSYYYPKNGSTTVSGVTSVSFDFEYVQAKTTGVQNFFTLRITDGTTTADIRLNPSLSNASTKVATYMYVQGVGSTSNENFRIFKNAEGSGSFSLADTNVGFVLNNETVAIDFYLGGEYFGSLTLEEIAVPYLNATQDATSNATNGNKILAIVENIKAGGEASISRLCIGGMKGSAGKTDIFVVDNFMFDDNLWLDERS